MPEFQADALSNFNKRLKDIIEGLRSLNDIVVRADITYFSVGENSHGFVVLRVLESKMDASGFPKLLPRKAIIVRLDLKGDIEYADINWVVADKISEVWSFHCKRMKVSPDFMVGLDGTHYFFGVSRVDYAPLSGKTWSPSEGSLLDKLIQLAESLCNSKENDLSKKFNLLLGEYLEELTANK